SAKCDRHFRIEYDSKDKALSAYFEPTPLVLPNYMSETEPGKVLPDEKLNSFLTAGDEQQIRKMTMRKVKGMLGAPNKAWSSDIHACRRDKSLSNYVYLLSPNGLRALVITFDEPTQRVYEYRLQMLERAGNPQERIRQLLEKSRNDINAHDNQTAEASLK